MTNGKWIPELFLDEVSPPARDTPEAWLRRDPDGVWRIDGDDCGAFCIVDGEIVAFMRLDEHGGATLTLTPTGWNVSAPMPAEAKNVCALDGMQADTLSDSVHIVVERLREIGADDDDFRLSYYSFVEIPLRFVAGDARFVPTDAPQAVRTEVADHG